MVWHGVIANLLRGLVFMVMFSAGAAALTLSALCGDLVIYFKNNIELAAVEQRLEVLRSLNADYEGLLDRVENDPNVIKNLAPGVGTELGDPDTAYPAVRTEELIAARMALAGVRQGPTVRKQMPQWLVRCSEPRRRWGLFLTGGALVVVAFVFFGLTHREGLGIAVTCKEVCAPDTSAEEQLDPTFAPGCPESGEDLSIGPDCPRSPDG